MMKNKLIFSCAVGFLLLACGVKNPLVDDKASHKYCDTKNNFCIQYPRAVFPSPQKGDRGEDLVLGLYSKEYDIRLLLSAGKNAANLSFDQIYQQQLETWNSTYDDVDEESSNIGADTYEVNASADGYHLFAKSIDLHHSGVLVNLRLVAGPEVNLLFFEDIKRNIFLFPNE